MKTLVFPDGNLYQYRCDGPLCNPDPRKITPKTDYSKMIRSAIYVREDDDKDYDNIQIEGWNYIVLKNRTIHVCPECASQIVMKLTARIKEVIRGTFSIDQASEEIANLLFDLEIYHD